MVKKLVRPALATATIPIGRWNLWIQGCTKKNPLLLHNNQVDSYYINEIFVVTIFLMFRGNVSFIFNYAFMNAIIILFLAIRSESTLKKVCPIQYKKEDIYFLRHRPQSMASSSHHFFFIYFFSRIFVHQFFFYLKLLN